MGATRPEAAEKTDAGRVAPIRGSVWCIKDICYSFAPIVGQGHSKHVS